MIRRRCCFLSMDSLAGYVSDDDLAIAPLADRGWEVETVSWRSSTTDWSSFEAVVVRTPWDYQRSPAEFLSVLRNIDRSDARLENALSVIEWNLDKRYLRDMEIKGVRIVPTVWSDGDLSEEYFARCQEQFGSDELVIKPSVSATAADTYRLKRLLPELAAVFAQRSFLVQPYVSAIASEGEYSLFFFGGEYSHAILKVPKPGDFRVQEEHGGEITETIPDLELRSTAEAAMAMIEPVPLYARVDLVRDAADGGFMLMELELIEPALYFRMNAASPHRFAEAFHQRMNEL